MLSYNQRWLKNLYDRAPAPAQNLLTSAYGFTHQRKVRGRYYFSYLAQLQQSQWLSFDQLQASQHESLQRFIAYAYARSPYWRRVFNEHAIAPDSIKSEEDLRRLPVLEKKHCAPLWMKSSRMIFKQRISSVRIRAARRARRCI
jgi:phenylacetate-coenzyme A ligase PaaK-like adenylate-forming protein